MDIKSKNPKNEISIHKSSIIDHTVIVNLPKLARQKRTKVDFDKISQNISKKTHAKINFTMD